MRGDSLRDLYAKALAVLGLGMLAGAGALVDFWPTETQGPRILSAFARPSAAIPLTYHGELPAPPTTFARNRVSRSASDIAERVIDHPPSIPIDAPATSVAGAPVALSSPVITAVETAPEEAAMPAEELNESVPAYELATNGLRLAPVSEPTADGGGFITTTFKKTGASIIRGGAKTGASIFDAFRAIGGAVRKAFPG